ncbi:MAG: hypothetical protein AAB657_03055, partial [Patescibacteria group bacterium]
PEGILFLSTPYDWKFSPAPYNLQVKDMKLVLKPGQWIIKKEIFDVPYTVPLNFNTDRKYKCHFLVLTKQANGVYLDNI